MWWHEDSAAAYPYFVPILIVVFFAAANGGFLLGLWGLKDTIVDAITLHHAPGAAASDVVPLADLLYVGELVVGELETGAGRHDPAGAADPIDPAWLARNDASVLARARAVGREIWDQPS